MPPPLSPPQPAPPRQPLLLQSKPLPPGPLSRQPPLPPPQRGPPPCLPPCMSFISPRSCFSSLRTLLSSLRAGLPQRSPRGSEISPLDLLRS
ncbi:hypothetical protein FGO68_gene11208 [Halteria grandinella]|uniref:Uncharacterized protein n=1 Tax=Halteria grandinella TaxID=5974 RepID=A0A8J8NSA7_HALGN|nr:hypothetical protein FGO68_gene11208 [Halteria grandinella]